MLFVWGGFFFLHFHTLSNCLPLSSSQVRLKPSPEPFDFGRVTSQCNHRGHDTKWPSLPFPVGYKPQSDDSLYLPPSRHSFVIEAEGSQGGQMVTMSKIGYLRAGVALRQGLREQTLT